MLIKGPCQLAIPFLRDDGALGHFRNMFRQILANAALFKKCTENDPKHIALFLFCWNLFRKSSVPQIFRSD